MAFEARRKSQDTMNAGAGGERLWRGDGDDGGHAAGGALVAAMAEKVGFIAKGAGVGGVDLVKGYAGVAELAEGGGGQIDVRFESTGVAVDGLAEACLLEGGRDVGADLEMVGADGRANGGDDVLRLEAVSFGQGANRGGDDAGHDAAPAGVSGGNGFSIAGGEKDGHAVGGADRQHAIRFASDHGVRGRGGGGFDRAAGDMPDVGAVDLPGFGAYQAGVVQGSAKATEVFGHGQIEVIGGRFFQSGQVERGVWAATCAAASSGKGVNDAEVRQARRLIEDQAVVAKGSLEHGEWPAECTRASGQCRLPCGERREVATATRGCQIEIKHEI